jgi:hypothetical protein
MEGLMVRKMMNSVLRGLGMRNSWKKNEEVCRNDVLAL